MALKDLTSFDPRTGYSIDNNLLSVTIKQATLADGFAILMMVMGLDSAKEFALAHNYNALILFSENGKILSWSSPNFFNTQDRSITLRKYLAASYLSQQDEPSAG